MVQYRVAHNEIKTGSGKSETIAIRDGKFDAAREVRRGSGSGGKILSRLTNHIGRMIHGDELPVGQPPGKFQNDLAGTSADVQSVALPAPVDKRDGMLDEGVVNAVEMLLRRSRSIGLDFSGIVHDFGFGNAWQVEPTH